MSEITARTNTWCDIMQKIHKDYSAVVQCIIIGFPSSSFIFPKLRKLKIWFIVTGKGNQILYEEVQNYFDNTHTRKCNVPEWRWNELQGKCNEYIIQAKYLSQLITATSPALEVCHPCTHPHSVTSNGIEAL